MSGLSDDNIDRNVDEKLCASCGTAQSNDIKLKPCPNCDLDHYCSDVCQQEHLQNEATCKKRSAEINDEILFRQPKCSHVGDCMICFLPLPLEREDNWIAPLCCNRKICDGCMSFLTRNHNPKDKEKLGWKRVGLFNCPFCRQPYIPNVNAAVKNWKKRAEANDPVALFLVGLSHFEDEDYNDALSTWTRSANLGDVESHYYLATLYQGHVAKDEKKRIHHLEQAAISGHAEARYELGQYELTNERFNRAVSHFMISAKLGHDRSLSSMKECYIAGHASKDDFAVALRAHQMTIDATKSASRDEAKKTFKLLDDPENSKLYELCGKLIDLDLD